MEERTIIRGKATPGLAKPPCAVNSVFDTGAAPKATQPRVASKVDPMAIEIEQGVAMPETVVGVKSPWPDVYARMKKGYMVRLTHRQAVSFQSWGKKAKASLARRTLGPDTAGVWRTA
jgi:hypothetical protein